MFFAVAHLVGATHGEKTLTPPAHMRTLRGLHHRWTLLKLRDKFMISVFVLLFLVPQLWPQSAGGGDWSLAFSYRGVRWSIALATSLCLTIYTRQYGLSTFLGNQWGGRLSLPPLPLS